MFLFSLHPNFNNLRILYADSYLNYASYGLTSYGNCYPIGVMVTSLGLVLLILNPEVAPETCGPVDSSSKAMHFISMLFSLLKWSALALSGQLCALEGQVKVLPIFKYPQGHSAMVSLVFCTYLLSACC
jgi:hypothetical protein